jgi:IS605 OrfB family transposase
MWASSRLRWLPLGRGWNPRCRWRTSCGGCATGSGCTVASNVARAIGRKWAAGLARLHRRIRCQRGDFLHKATTDLAKTKSVVVVEDLSVRGMIRHRHLARSIGDAGWGELRRMLACKTEWYGSRLVIAPRFHPIHHDMLGLRPCEKRYATERADLPVRGVWAGAGSGPECGAESRVARRREFPGDAKCLWRGSSGRENSLVKPAPTKQEPSSRKPSAATGENKRL